MVTESSAAGEPPLAVANGATPVASLTLNGPSTRIRSKPLTPKLRVAASAGAAAARKMRAGRPRGRKVRMARTFTALWLRSSLRTVGHEHCTLPEPALLTLHFAPPVTRTSPDPAISTDAVPVAWAATLPEPAIDTEAVSATTAPASMSPEPAIPYSATAARPRPALISPDPAIPAFNRLTLISATRTLPE